VPVLNPATGLVDVPPGTPAGPYTIIYEICEELNPTNCEQATVTVTVDPSPILPDDDSVSGIDGAAGAMGVLDVLDGDLLNGVQTTLADVDINVLTPATPVNPGDPVPVLNPATGLVDVPAGTPSGTYTIVYEICEELNPMNCEEATVTVTVDGATIAPDDDSVSGINGATGAMGVLDVLDGDLLNGVQTTLAEVDIAVLTPATPLTPGAPVPVLDPATGLVDVPAGTPAGTYTIVYEICEELNPTNCEQATVTVEVEGAPIVADPDEATGINGADGGTGVLDVLDGDTLNGDPATLATVDIEVLTPATPVNPSDPVPTLDPATGLVDVPAGTPAGTYEIEYQICEELNPTNCSTNTATIIVDPPAIMADPDDVAGVNGADGGDNVLDVLDGDTLNGVPATLATVDIEVLTPATPVNPGDPVPTLDPATGQISVPPGTPAGTYTIEYQICEELNPTNCTTAIATVEVDAPEITAEDDEVVGVNGADGADDVINAFDNDMLNGMDIDPDDITATVLTPATPVTPGAPVPELDPETGLVDVPPGTPAGTYTIVYEVCETLNPTNCAEASITIEVEPPVIEATDDVPEPVRSGIGSDNAINAFDNDTLNGEPVDPADITATVLTPAADPGVVLDPETGVVSVSPDVPAGTYTIVYEICEDLNPTNCSTSTVTVVVEAPISALEGTVFNDDNGDEDLQQGENGAPGYIVQVLDENGDVIAETVADADGNYSIEGLPSDTPLTVQFINPENNVVFQTIEDLTLTPNATTSDVNAPIDPSGIIYDSVERTPISGATLNLVDDMGNPLPEVCYVDASQANQTTGASGEYRFDIIPGAAPQCPLGETEYTISIEPPAGFSGPSTVIPPLEGPFDPTGLTAPVRINPTNDIPTDPTPPYYFDFVLETGDPDVIFNHIPLDPFLSRGELIVTKTSIKRTANVGDVVPYEIVVRNAENAPRADVDVVDILPSGTKYVAGTSLVDGVPTEPVNSGRTLTWEDQIIPANGSVTYNLALIIGAGVTAGEKVNTGLAQNGADGSDISNRGTAVVTIVPSTVFDCSELIGKVFEDRNRNGYQDENEPGVPGVRLATVNGLLVTTDEFGRYHIACAAVPDSRIGSNFVIKLDTRTLPLGWNTTSHNPRSIRLTRGKFGELNFGVAPEEMPETRTEGGE
nr:DUF11 domain-containing protein [Gammaproteobacteria bacterium]